MKLDNFFDKYKEDLSVFFTTNTSSIKFKEIKANPNVAITYLNPGEGKGFTLKGQAEIIEDQIIKEELWLDWWSKYYSKGVTDPDYSVIKLKPRSIEIWYRGIYILNFE